MQCVTPMFYYYKLGEKKKGHIVPRQEVLSELKYDENYIRHCLELKNKEAIKTDHRYIQVPCNHCWACQLKYSGEWATRITLEAKKYDNNYFLTLTYNDENVPIASKTEWDEYNKEPDGTVTKKHEERENDGTWSYTLDRPELITFLGSLREHLAEKGHRGLKYYYCGEYGSETHRPHYHIALLNCPLDINEFYGAHIDSNYKTHWKSKEIENIWATGASNSKNRKPKGMIDLAELEWSCAAYVARYCTKKLYPDQDKRAYLEQGLMPEFVGMSKGIGFDYFNEHMKEIYDTDSIVMRTVKGNVGTVKPPRAFDRKLEKINPELYKMIKRSREKAADRSQELLKSLTDATDKMQIAMKADKLQTKMQMLPRVGEW